MTPDHVRGRLSSDAGVTSSSIISPTIPSPISTLSTAPFMMLSPASTTSDNLIHRRFPYGLLRLRGFPATISGIGMPPDIAYSACALAIERTDATRIGRVRGVERQSYTQGVVCTKVARYAERQHHPERLSVPLRRVGEKGGGRDAFVPISWDAALDEVAESLTLA